MSLALANAAEPTAHSHTGACHCGEDLGQEDSLTKMKKKETSQMYEPIQWKRTNPADMQTPLRPRYNTFCLSHN